MEHVPDCRSMGVFRKVLLDLFVFYQLPAKAGGGRTNREEWIPSFEGMTFQYFCNWLEPVHVHHHPISRGGDEHEQAKRGKTTIVQGRDVVR